MLKKVMVMLASKYLAVKAKMRAIETRLIIYSLLLRDKKGVRHLFRQGICLNLPNEVEDEEYQSYNIAAFVHDPNATAPVSILHLPEENKGEDKMGIEEDDDYPDLRRSDAQMDDHLVSVIEMVKNAKEGQGKKFRMEDDIDRAADLFIQRFHHQIRLQKLHSEPPLSYIPV